MRSSNWKKNSKVVFNINAIGNSRNTSAHCRLSKKKKKVDLEKLHLFSVSVCAVFPMSHRDLDTFWLYNNIQSSKGLKAACPVRSGSHRGGLCHPSHAHAHGFVVP